GFAAGENLARKRILDGVTTCVAGRQPERSGVKVLEGGRLLACSHPLGYPAGRRSPLSLRFSALMHSRLHFGLRFAVGETGPEYHSRADFFHRSERVPLGVGGDGETPDQSGFWAKGGEDAGEAVQPGLKGGALAIKGFAQA